MKEDQKSGPVSGPLPDCSSVYLARCRMSSAKAVLSIYLVITILMVAWFEWQAARYGFIEGYHIIPYGLLSAVFLMVSLVAFTRMAVKRAFAPALIYACIPITMIASYIFSSEIMSFKMGMKARLFSAYPQLCQRPPLSGELASICYKYEVRIEPRWSREKLVFNPGDEMLTPASQWPEGIKRSLGIDVKTILKDDDCHWKPRNMVGHVYWVSDHCW